MSGKRRTKQMKNQPIVARPPVTTASGIVVADWQRLPRQLLQEHIQRIKTYSKPEYHKANCNEDGKHRCRVVLKHVKNDDRTLKFAPDETFESFDLAKEFAALLALKNLCGDLTLDRKFPEPFKSAWLSFTTSTPAVTTKARFHCDYDRQQAQRESAQQKKRSENIKEARKHFQGAQRSKLAMDNEHRQMLEHVLNSTSSDHGQVQDDLHSRLSAKLSTAVASELTRLGFYADDIDLCLNQAPFVSADQDMDSARDTALQWLLVNIAERRLPAGYRAKDSSAIVAIRGASPDHDQLSIEDRLRRLGYPSLACQTASEQCSSYDDARLHLWVQMIEFLSSGPARQTSGFSSEDQQAEIEAEQVALSAIYDDAFTILNERCWEVALPDLQLRLRIEARTGYPGVVPFIEVFGDQLSAADRVAIQQALVVQVAIQAASEISPVTHACIEHLQQNHEQILESYRPRWPAYWILAPSTITSSPVASPKPARKIPRPTVPKTLDSSLNEVMKERWLRRCDLAEYRSISKGRARLPVWQHRHELMECISINNIVVVCAETGSGKSTQIPAFLLDHAVHNGHGAKCRVICAQPRRISAVSLAERVAQEYCEKVGETVGYRIRLESKTSKDTHIEYVTNGLLLRQLLSDQNLTGVTHVVLDEVHERSVEIDLLLLVLRQLCQRRSDFKLVLMSATLQLDLISSYFNGCPVVQVPGRAFPVDVLYLEDVIEATSYIPSERYRIKSKFKRDEMESNIDGTLSEHTQRSLQSLNPNICNIDLVVVAIWHIITAWPSESGAILCFLPGVGEISSAIRQFTRSLESHQKSSSDFMLVPLHGSLSTSEQSRVFQRPPPGVRKIVFATNVAETSVTVNDVTFVIDSGRMRQTQFDTARNVSMLVETFVSRSNAKQRQGRAGRVRSGICIRLFTRGQYDRMPDEHPSELNRISLDHVCLQIRGLLTSTSPLLEIFNEMIEPPQTDAVHRAICTLRTIGAFEETSEKLTGLGRHLCALPIDVRLGKMIILATCFSCLTPIIRIAALMSVSGPFVGGADHRENISRIRAQYAANTSSDHIALLRIFESWLECRAHSSDAAKRFCSDNYVSDVALKSALDVSLQYRDALLQLGFIAVDKSNMKSDLGLAPIHDQNSGQMDLVTAVLTAGLYPNVLLVQYPEQRFQQTLTGAIAKAHESRSIRYYRSDRERVFLHPSSVNFHATSYPYPYLAYLEQRHTSKLYVYDTSVMAPYALLMFGGRIQIRYDQNQILVDDWIRLDAAGRIGALVSGLRKELDQLLMKKIEDPAFDITSHNVAKAVITLFVSGGGFT